MSVAHGKSSMNLECSSKMQEIKKMMNCNTNWVHVATDFTAQERTC